MPETGSLVLAGHVFTGEGEIPRGEVEVVGDRIARVGGRTAVEGSGRRVGAATGWRDGLLIVPGFVDIHCHGGGGGEFGGSPEGSVDAARAAIGRHRRQGTTSLVASLVSAPPERLMDGVRTCAKLAAQGELAGVHLEGPFLSETRCGAQDPRVLLDVDPGLVDRLVTAAVESGAPDAIVQLTYAPERRGAAGLPAVLCQLGVVPAIGHTDADARSVRSALAAASGAVPRGGRPLVTHLFNGMPPMHHRNPGPVAAALASAASGEAVLELIADGVHLHPDMVRMVFETVGPQGICLVSDAMSASGMPVGRYRLGDREVEVAAEAGGKAARLLGQAALAGGVGCLLDLVRGCVRDAGVSVADAVAAATRTPALELGLPDVGLIEAGRRADLVVLDQDLSLVGVLRSGEWVVAPGDGGKGPVS